MRRIGLGAFAIALTLGAASVASAQQPAQGQQGQRQEQHKGQWQRHDRRHGERALLKGIKLTDQQKAQLKQVRERYAVQAKELRQSLRPASTRGQAQTKEQRREQRETFRSSPQFQRFRALREQEMRDVRAALTPDQQRTFDRNVQEQKARMEKWQKKHAERQEQRRGG